MLEEDPSDLIQPILDPVWRPPISCGFLMCSLLSGVSTGVLTGLLGSSVARSMSSLEAFYIGLGAGLLGSLFHAFDYRYGFLVNGLDAKRSYRDIAKDLVWYPAVQVFTAIMSCIVQSHLSVSINDTATCFFWGAMVTILPVRHTQICLCAVGFRPGVRYPGINDYNGDLVEARAQRTVESDNIVDSDQLPTAVAATARSMGKIVQAVLFPAASPTQDGVDPQNPLYTV
ncbi:MAG: hypothetical protein CMF55_04885 [Legionellales bacterium]|nr:hypothetical protein [Legionellales bacterium]